ncbi:MAG: rRNA maturation RNase YbeY [bacterium]
MRDVVKKILKDLGCPDEVEVSIVFVNDKRIRQLNRLYRGINRPTDVLAYSMQEGEGKGINPYILGDIVVSVETTMRQADEYGHSFEKELDVLMIHGLLHLLGYDHEKEGDAVKMQVEEKRLLGLIS